MDLQYGIYLYLIFIFRSSMSEIEKRDQDAAQKEGKLL